VTETNGDTSDPNPAVETLADAWASMDGRWTEFIDEGDPDGVRKGYLCDAEILLDHLERRGWTLDAAAGSSTPGEPSTTDPPRPSAPMFGLGIGAPQVRQEIVEAYAYWDEQRAVARFATWALWIEFLTCVSVIIWFRPPPLIDVLLIIFIAGTGGAACRGWAREANQWRNRARDVLKLSQHAIPPSP
jgi:hypothetical protein